MFEQDYIIRLVKEMVRAILKLLFNMDVQEATEGLAENKEQEELLENLLDMIDSGNINKAENHLDDFINKDDVNTLKIALLFYSYLNDKTDDFLEESDFSREEIVLGMENVADSFGLSSIARTFLTDL